MSNFYEVLGLAVGAEPEDIKAAFHKLAKRSHPDVNADDSTAEERFKAVNQAYEILSDSEKRATYNLGLKHKLTALHRRWQIAMAAACLVVTLACGLSVFMVSQYYVSQESTGKVTQQVAELTNLLNLEKGKGGAQGSPARLPGSAACVASWASRPSSASMRPPATTPTGRRSSARPMRSLART